MAGKEAENISKELWSANIQKGKNIAAWQLRLIPKKLPVKVNPSLRIALGLAVFCTLQIGGKDAFSAEGNPPAVAAGAPARIAIIAAGREYDMAIDLLTVELSQRKDIILLERNEIEKVIREQKLTAGGLTDRDALKLGQILGADGILALETAKAGTNAILNAQLIAVKPGVGLDSFPSAWPRIDPEWGKRLANHFDTFYPKLAVLPKDALAISVLNVRAAARTSESTNLEHNLTLLLLNRLMRERELFVLERRRLDLLSAEKDLNKINETSFWNGSYVLEGTIDKNGFSPDRIVLSVRLSPPQGGGPIEIEAAGPRSNPPEVIEQLSQKILQWLKRKSTAPEWKPTEESTRYYDEAKWALKWGAFSTAQAAAESAWALGKQDMDCAMVRIRSYLAEVPPDTGGYEHRLLQAKFLSTQTIRSTDFDYARTMTAREKGLGLVFFPTPDNSELAYAWVHKKPDPQNIKTALHALELYYDYALTLPANSLKPDSAFGLLGIQSLNAVSLVLQHFHFMPEAISPVADELAELRALARKTAAWIANAPAIHNTYWLGSRVAKEEELHKTLAGTENIFACVLNYGCFWQDRPEDCLTMYRELLGSAAFSYIDAHLCFRTLEQPRLTGWNGTDRGRIPKLWEDFLGELAMSSNAIFRIEGCMLVFVDAVNDPAIEAAGDALFSTIFASASALQTNNIEATYTQSWLFFFSAMNQATGMVRAGREKVQQRYSSEYAPRLEVMHREYWARAGSILDQQRNDEIFAAQKQLLTDGRLHDDQTLLKTFMPPRFGYTQNQAMEIQPLLEAYKSNLIARVTGQTGIEQVSTRQSIRQVEGIQRTVRQALTPAPISSSGPAPETGTSKPPQAAGGIGFSIPPRAIKSNTISTPMANAPPPANLVFADRFVKIPDQYLPLSYDETIHFPITPDARCFDHDRVWFFVNYPNPNREYNAVLLTWLEISGEWEAIQDPIKVDSEEIASNGTHSLHPNVTLAKLNDDLFIGQWRSIKRFDIKSRRWEKLQIPAPGEIRVFACNGRLYGASEESIFEIMEHGQKTQILASSRRRPAVSVLDSLEAFYQPAVFAGPGGRIRASVGNRIYEWGGQDWSSIVTPAYHQLEIFEQGVLLRANSQSRGSAMAIWRLAETEAKTEQVWYESPRDNMPGAPGRRVPAATTRPDSPKSKWDALPELSLVGAAMTLDKSNALFLAAHFGMKPAPGGDFTPLEKDGRHADLVTFDKELNAPLAVPIKFDLERGQFPFDTSGHGVFKPDDVRPWFGSLSNHLIIGQGTMMGFWLISKAEAGAAIDRERLKRGGETQRDAASAEKRRKDLLAKYDKNQNGRIDDDEKIAAINDPLFLEAELAAIDANHDGWLEAEELGYFDVNKNGLLEPDELAGIEITQRLLAAKLFAANDKNHDGVIDGVEFQALQEIFPARGGAFIVPNLNYNPAGEYVYEPLKLDGLETYLMRQTWGDVKKKKSKFRSPIFAGPRAGGKAEEEKLFKTDLEAYWKFLNAGGTGRP